MKIRRLIAWMLAVVVVCGLLAGCGNNAADDSTTSAPKEDMTDAPATEEGTDAPVETTEEPTPDYSVYRVTEPITITFWYSGKANQAFYDGIVAEFNAMSAETLVTVEATCIGTVSAVQEQLSSAHAAKTGLPAVSVLNYPVLAQFYKNGVLSDLTELLAANDYDMSGILDGLVNQVTIDGAITALPWACNALTYYYNKTELAKHGLDTFPETWEEYKTWCKAVYDATGMPAATYDSANANMLYTMALNFGGSLLEEGDETKTALDNEQVKQRFKELKELVDAGYIEWSVEGAELVQTKFVQGDTMSIMLSSADYGDCLSSVAGLPAEDQFEVSLAWTWEDAHRYYTVAGNSFIIPQEIPQKEKNAAAVFLAWLATAENQPRWAEWNSVFMTHKENVNNQEKINQMYAETPEVNKLYSMLSDYYVEKEQTAYFNPAMKVFYMALQEIYLAGGDFDTVYAQAIEDVEYILAGN